MTPTEDPQGFWMQNPVAARFLVTSRFNDPRHYPNSPDKKQRHEGIDLNAVDSSGRPVPVVAGQRGLVDKVANFPPGYGRYIRIRHQWPTGDVYVTWYGHLSRIDVKEGDFLIAGQHIGIAGDTGNAFGIHLHLTLQHIGHGLKNYVVDDVIDPFPFFHFGPPPSVDELNFVADETIPDGTILQPGQTFPKTWRVRNSGSTSWEAGYELAFTGGEGMGGPQAIALPAADPGDEVSITINLTAPSKAGRFQSIWKPRDPGGTLFNWELFTDIIVASPTQDDARYMADVTIPDGTGMTPGQTFLKTWRVKNTGTTTWNSTYRLAFFEDHQMEAPDNIPLPFTRPGEEAEISITLKAPPTPGSYQSTWQLRNSGGQVFGDLLFALIQVVREEEPEVGVDEMSYVDDVTIEDGTPLQPGQQFEKIWRVRNTGTTTWKAGYELAFFKDEQMGGPDSIPLPTAKPGQTVDLSVSLTAPTAPGRYRSTWKGRNPQGEIFEFDMYAEIEVVRSAIELEEIDDAKFIRDVTIPDGTVKQSGEVFLKTWRLRNTGTTTWAPGFELAFNADDQMGAGASVPLPPVEPGAEANVSVRLTAPMTPGIHKSTWRPRNPQGEIFGHFFYALISVPTPVPARDQRDGALFIEHATFQPGADARAGQRIRKLWRVRNTGTTTWGGGYTLAFVEGDTLAGPDSVAVAQTEPSKTTRLGVPLIVPTIPGRYRGVWKLRDPQGNFFGPRLVVSIEVK